MVFGRGKNIVGVNSLAELIAMLETPRRILLMVHPCEVTTEAISFIQTPKLLCFVRND